MRHYIYKITDTITGEYYIGVRSCISDPETDLYFGSGDWIKSHKKEYGIRLQRSNGRFIKIILETAKNRKDAFLLEKKWVGDKWSSDPLCMNKMCGGIGVGNGKDHYKYDNKLYHLWDHIKQTDLYINKSNFKRIYGTELWTLMNGICLYENKNHPFYIKGGTIVACKGLCT